MFTLNTLPAPIATVPLVATVITPGVMDALGWLATDPTRPSGGVGYMLDRTVVMVDGDVAYSHTYASRADALLAWCLI